MYRFYQRYCYILESISDSKEIAYPSGDSEWIKANGMLHRKDGPAVITRQGDKEWYIDGRLHRIGGPAIELFNGAKYWYVDGRLHRLDGPAVERADGTKAWYIDGIGYPYKEWKRLVTVMNAVNMATQKGSKKAGLNLDV